MEYVDEIGILGGEPFLNRDLDKYIDLVRNVYPYAKITVVTNGLLLNRISDAHIEAIKRNRANISISAYPPVLSSLDTIVSGIRDRGIEVSVREVAREFAYTFDEKGGHAVGAKTLNCSCPNLYKGHLVVCPPIAYLGYFNEYFGTDLDDRDGMIDIYDENLTFAGLVSELHKIRNVCDRCLFISKEDRVSQKWEQSSNIKISDYVIGV